ncbi:hypothetical protein [Myxococcus landrumensis]|uniref:Resolvase HTH domain-containing protein n=1 Tax=Myxococcus landrumensis TaxID=2813577 RepID=A0ABX7NI77_9BACT|nr:hypothetical protein [Myxococcus landrumus]QSQ17194.1 hypothetical protein JY572_14525 [Myxococcus landrumus]
MQGKNKYSKTNEWKDLVGKDTQARAIAAKSMRDAGMRVVDIAAHFDLTPGRIYEYLRK